MKVVLLLSIGVLLCVALQVASLPTASNLHSLRFIREAQSWRLGKNPEVDMNTTELIRSKGYPVESHKVTTEDGYILGVFRIPHGRHNKEVKGTRPVVLLQHGLLGDGDDFLVNLADQSLAFILADAGADVWIGNSRGDIHSREHTRLDPRGIDFWRFSWDEMAEYDLPATIYYVLNQTHQEQLYYVGHSQGTAIAFARFSEDQELASRVKHFMALAPIARVGNTVSPIRLLVPFAAEIEFFLNVFGHGMFDSPKPILKFLAGTICEGPGAILCELSLFFVCGFNGKSFNTSRTDVYISHGEGGTSSLTLVHWAQAVRSKQFQHFDYGEKENLKKYGQKNPPLYDPHNIKVPVAIFRGGNDWLADNTDVEWLLPQLNVTHDIYVPFYEHLDMIWATDANVRMYKDLVNIVMAKG